MYNSLRALHATDLTCCLTGPSGSAYSYALLAARNHTKILRADLNDPDGVDMRLDKAVAMTTTASPCQRRTGLGEPNTGYGAGVQPGEQERPPVSAELLVALHVVQHGLPVLVSGVAASR